MILVMIGIPPARAVPTVPKRTLGHSRYVPQGWKTAQLFE
jgi:hypothetical protein